MPAQVLYDVRGILEKNRDTFRDDILNMLKDSRQDIQTLKTNTSFLPFNSFNLIRVNFESIQKEDFSGTLGMMQSVCLCNSLCLSCTPRLDFIYDLFEKVGSRNNEEKMGTARRKPTVSSQFRVCAGSILYSSFVMYMSTHDLTEE